MGENASPMTSRWMLAALALNVAGCASLMPRRAEVPPGPRGLDTASPEERADYLRRAHVWRSVATSTLDLLAGPAGEGSFSFEEDVTCDYDPGVPPSGATPKFFCRLASGETVKVKYGQVNAEVYGEVAGTRFFWALGFGTDRQYPVRVTCRNCSSDPWRNHAAEPGAVHTFHPAIIERKAEGTPIQVKRKNDGWEWWELQTVDERLGGAPRAHVDALRLLAAFIQHTDNKDEQQRLNCLPGGVQLSVSVQPRVMPLPRRGRPVDAYPFREISPQIGAGDRGAGWDVGRWRDSRRLAVGTAGQLRRVQRAVARLTTPA